LISFFFVIIWERRICLSINEINSLSECLITIETQNGLEKCSYDQCYKHINPFIIIHNSSLVNQCQIDYLKSPFSDYEKLLEFVDNQSERNYFIEDLFSQKNSEITTFKVNIIPFQFFSFIFHFQVQIEHFDASNDQEFLTLDMLLHLAGNKEKINRFIIEIQNWEQTELNHIIYLEENVLNKQPFQQIDFIFKCNYNQIFVQ
jgi:hypothetical protein